MKCTTLRLAETSRRKKKRKEHVPLLFCVFLERKGVMRKSGHLLLCLLAFPGRKSFFSCGPASSFTSLSFQTAGLLPPGDGDVAQRAAHGDNGPVQHSGGGGGGGVNTTEEITNSGSGKPHEWNVLVTVRLPVEFPVEHTHTQTGQNTPPPTMCVILSLLNIKVAL